jgi:hypothetical protein
MSESEERENRIRVIDRRRFYLDDDGEVRERETEESLIELGTSTVRTEPSGEPRPPTAAAPAKEPFWQRFKRKLIGA